MKKSLMRAFLLVMFMTLFSPCINVEAACNRDDGKWLFPLPESQWNKFSDYAGCHGNNACLICGVIHTQWPEYPDDDGNIWHNSAPNYGIDVAAGSGTNVYAARAGYVYYRNSLGNNGRGRYAIVEHPLNDQYSYYSLYQHLSAVNNGVHENGSWVDARDVIGSVGKSGAGENSYPSHLHFEVFIGEKGGGQTLVDNVVDDCTQKYYTPGGSGYLKEDGIKKGAIITNPKNVDSKPGSGYGILVCDQNGDGEKGSVTCSAHRGSITYVFNKSEVGGASTNPNIKPVTINGTNFPDEDFRDYVSDKFDQNKDGTLSVGEISAVEEIYIPWDVKNLKGIGTFVCLRYLDFDYNKFISTVNLSKNTALEQLHCEDSNLMILDVSNNKELVILNCSNNKLDALYLSENKMLEELDCSGNQLKKLDLRNNTSLRELDCYKNQITELNVNIGIEHLHCWGNCLSELNVSKYTNLTCLQCGENKISTLDISNNRSLEWLSCDDNRLSTLDVSNNPCLEILNCDRNQLAKLDVTHNTLLSGLSCSDNKLTTLNLSECFMLKSLHCMRNKIKLLDFSENERLCDNIGKRLGGELLVEYDEGVIIIKYGEMPPTKESSPNSLTQPEQPKAAPAHTEVPNWTMVRGNVVAVDKNGQPIKKTGVVTWRGYNLLIANGVLYKKPTFFQDKVDGKWKYFQNGILAKTGNTFIPAYGKLLHVNNGVLDTTDGFVKYNGKFVYSYHGMAATSYTGWVKYDKYKCYLVKGALAKITR